MTTTNETRPPTWLQSAGIVATIVLATLALISALVATIHFTIKVDVSPQLGVIESRLSTVETHLDQLQASSDAHYEALNQRLGRIEGLLEQNK